MATRRDPAAGGLFDGAANRHAVRVVAKPEHSEQEELFEFANGYRHDLDAYSVAVMRI